jgi:hypothetical protein
MYRYWSSLDYEAFQGTPHISLVAGNVPDSMVYNLQSFLGKRSF